MIVCPVCEHQQAAAAECAVCGKPLVRAATPAPPAQPMAELELNRHPAGPVRATPLPELELTRIVGGPELPVAPLADLERAGASAAEVPVEPLGDLERGRFEDSAPRTTLPVGAATCRYCRNVQAEGLFCDRCGMRLPRHSASGASPKIDTDEPVMVRHACGAKTEAGLPCSECGAPVPLPSE